MRVLRSVTTEFDTHFFDHDGELKRLEVHSVVVPVKDICPGMKPETRPYVPGFDKLENSILEEGLKNPIIIVPNRKDYFDWGLADISEDCRFDYDPAIPFLCIFGSQRLCIASKNDYEAIDCFYFEDVNKGLLVGKLLESKSYM
jgi:hypothetical protein